ncbi:MAG: Hsp20/alpha crystallin family protein [Verrucomicrobiales bacterium]|nr:Hsp20/alpha crystallin family protein [Verrucomicrobiales bacterium]
MNTPTCTPTQSSTCTPTTAKRTPRYHVSNDDASCRVQVELPGLARDEVKIRIEDGILTLTGERATALPDSWKEVHRELPRASYELRLRLPNRLDDSQLAASLADGVLEITLPVRESAQPREISIQ